MNQSNSTVTEFFFGLTWSAYIRLALSLFGVVLNLLNILVFLSPKLKGPCYQLMLVKSVANLFYNSFSVATEFATYCVNCEITQYYASVVYTIVVNFYISSCVALLRILIEIAVSIYTFCILQNKFWSKKRWSIVITVALVVITCSVYAPRLFAYTPFRMPGSKTIYRISLTSFGLSDAFRIIGYVQQFLRIFFAVVVSSIINLVNMVKFKRRFSKNRICSLATFPSGDNLAKVSIVTSGKTGFPIIKGLHFLKYKIR